MENEQKTTTNAGSENDKTKNIVGSKNDKITNVVGSENDKTTIVGSEKNYVGSESDKTAAVVNREGEVKTTNVDSESDKTTIVGSEGEVKTTTTKNIVGSKSEVKTTNIGSESEHGHAHHAHHKPTLVKFPEQKKVVKYIKDYVVVFFAAILQAVGVYVFVQPNDFSPGGFLGIGTFVEYLTDGKVPAGVLFFVINIPLIIIAFFKFKKDFIIKTILTIFLDSLFLELLEVLHMQQFVVEPNMGYAFILAAIAGGIMCGASIALLLKVDGCNGGTEIIGGLLQKKFPATNISWFIFALDSSVIVLSAFCTHTDKFGSGFASVLIPMLLSLCKMFCASKTSETILRGMSSAIKFEVVTPHGEELAAELTSKVGRGVTIINAKGAYTGTEKQILICILRKRQMATFKRVLSRYPDTFAYMVSTSEVYGKGFTKQVKEGEKDTVV